jgi:archaeosine synthase
LKDYVQDRKVIAHVSGGYKKACEEVLDNVVYTCNDENTRSQESLTNLKEEVKKADKINFKKHKIHDLRSIARYQFNTKKADNLIPENTKTHGKFNTRIMSDKQQLATLHFETGLFTLNLAGGEILKEEKINRVFINFDLKTSTLFTPGIDKADKNIIPNDEVVIIKDDEVIGVGKSMMNGEELVKANKGIGVKIRHQIK